MSATFIRRLTTITAAAVGLLIVWLLVQDFDVISPDGLGDDATQNVRSSINFARYGTYSSLPISPDVVPGFRREPVPNVLLAFYLRVANVLSPGLLDQANEPFSDAFLLVVKQINLVWAAALFFGLWLTAALVFSPLLAAHGLAGLQILIVNHFFVLKTIDVMNTELIAGMILVWLSAMLLLAARTQSWRWLLLSGMVFGLLALTKATGAYVALALLPLIALALSGISRKFWISLLAVSFGFALAVMPWLVRNQIHFSKPVIAEGGGDVLMIRSVFNEMTGSQFVDAFYAYAPIAVRRDLLGPWMKLSSDDFSCEGRLAVFNRKLDCDRLALEEGRFADVLSFYQRGKRAIPWSLSLDGDQKKSMALRRFQERPLNALITSVPLGWRGIWGFRAKRWPSIVLNIAAYGSLLLAPALALLERRLSWLFVSIVPLSFFAFYSLFSHFLPRYSMPLIPAAIVCLTMVAVDLGARLFSRLPSAAMPPVRLI